MFQFLFDANNRSGYKIGIVFLQLGFQAAIMRSLKKFLIGQYYRNILNNKL